MFKVLIWCPDCYGEDPQGCFDGGSEQLEGEFKTVAAAEREGYKQVKGTIYKFEVLDEKGVPQRKEFL